MLALITRYSWGLLGFRLWLQLTRCAYLLTLSEYFKWGRTFRLWMKSEASLQTGGSIGVMKLRVWPSESDFGVDHQDSKVRSLGASIQLVQLYELMQFNIQDGHNTCEWTTYI